MHFLAADTESKKELVLCTDDNDLGIMRVSFESKFFREKNILCISGVPNDAQKYIVLFPTEERCMKYFSLTEDYKTGRNVKEEVFSNEEIMENFESNFVKPLLQQCMNNPASRQELSPFLIVLLKLNNDGVTHVEANNESYSVDNHDNQLNKNSCSDDDENECEEVYHSLRKSTTKQIPTKRTSDENVSVAKRRKINGDHCGRTACAIDDGSTNASVICDETSNKVDQQNVQKRRRKKTAKNTSIIGWDVAAGRKINSNRCGCTACAIDAAISNNSARCIRAPNFQLVKRKLNARIVQHLVIFDAIEKKKCYELSWHMYHKFFICNGCQRHGQHVYARKVNDEINGDYYELGRNQHVCELQDFYPEDAAVSVKEVSIEGIIIKEPDFQFVKRKVFGNQIVQNLIIFHHADKELCYEFTPNGKKQGQEKYICNNCIYKDKTHVEAKIMAQNDGVQSVEVFGLPHSCDVQIFVPENISQTSNDNVDKTSNNNDAHRNTTKFRLIKRKFRNKAIQHLIVFTSADKCYDYTWNRKKNSFICGKCLNGKRIQVSVRLEKNRNGEESLKFGTYEHQCKPVDYESEDSDINDLDCEYP
uniref:Uncharacterized protein n=1 Tax=Panagrolaimus superbus TaxID=310955 RepID=A0A914YTC3_9BILA